MAYPNQPDPTRDPLQKPALGGATSIAGSTGTGSTGTASSTVQQAGQAARDQASAVWNDTKDSARSVLGDQQKAAASGLGQFAGALRKAAREMGDGGEQAPMSRMIESAADGLERFSGTLRERDLDGLMRDVESFARRQPIVFFGAAIAAGFLATRFMKATRPNDTRTMSSGIDRIDQQNPY
jgi:hypothetical protein